MTPESIRALTSEQRDAMTQEEREAAADVLLASVDLLPLCRKLADLTYDVWLAQVTREKSA